MHISEGVLSAPVLIAGGVFACAGIAMGLRRLDNRRIVLCGVLAAAFFVGSLIHVPIGLANAHLLLTGLLGVILGWAAIPAIFVALLLQAALFQYGGLSTLGVNTATMGFAAVCAWYVWRGLYRIIPEPWKLKVAGFCAGFLGVFMAALLTACALALSGEAFMNTAWALFIAHIPVMAVEGIVTAFTVTVIARVKPELLDFSTVERSDRPR